MKWAELSSQQRDAALEFIPPVYDQSLGPAFVSCVKAEEEKSPEFDLKVTLEGVGERGEVALFKIAIYYIKDALKQCICIFSEYFAFAERET